MKSNVLKVVTILFLIGVTVTMIILLMYVYTSKELTVNNYVKSLYTNSEFNELRYGITSEEVSIARELADKVQLDLKLSFIYDVELNNKLIENAEFMVRYGDIVESYTRIGNITKEDLLDFNRVVIPYLEANNLEEFLDIHKTETDSIKFYGYSFVKDKLTTLQNKAGGYTISDLESVKDLVDVLGSEESKTLYKTMHEEKNKKEEVIVQPQESYDYYNYDYSYSY